MTQICAGALCVGFLMAFILRFLPFAGSLMLSLLLGAGLSLTYGRSFGDTIIAALSILIACQVGYGLGLLTGALGDRVLRPHRRPRRADGSETAKRVRSGRD